GWGHARGSAHRVSADRDARPATAPAATYTTSPRDPGEGQANNGFNCGWERRARNGTSGRYAGGAWANGRSRSGRTATGAASRTTTGTAVRTGRSSGIVAGAGSAGAATQQEWPTQSQPSPDGRSGCSAGAAPW